VFVRPFPAGDGRWQISTPQGTEPRWSADGRELFYRWAGGLSVVRIDTSHGFVASRPERLFDRVNRAVGIGTYGVSPDGKRFFTFREATASAALRTVNLDLGLSRRISAATRPD
jgi:hypothetical protein